MKKTKILYWVFTGLFAFMMAGSAIPDVFSNPIAVEGMDKGLGYPLYFIPFIGVAKLLGVVVLLAPGLRKLKEWAYAGLAFDLVGATYSIIAVGKPISDWGGMALPLLLCALSYIYWNKKTGGSVHR